TDAAREAEIRYPHVVARRIQDRAPTPQQEQVERIPTLMEGNPYGTQPPLAAGEDAASGVGLDVPLLPQTLRRAVDGHLADAIFAHQLTHRREAVARLHPANAQQQATIHLICA